MCRSGGGIKATFSRKSWKERWFVLKGGVLSYHKTPVAPPLGEISIKDIVDIAASDAYDTSVSEFSIVTPDRTFYLKCNTPEDCRVCCAR